ACYEVPAALREEAAALLPQTWARTSWGTPSLDLRAGAVAELEAAGVPRAPVDAEHPCTLEDDRVYSYRRHPRTGRFAGVIRRDWSRGRSGRGRGGHAGDGTPGTSRGGGNACGTFGDQGPPRTPRASPGPRSA